MDPLIDNEGAKRFYHNWVLKALGGPKQVVHADGDFCGFAESDGAATIDLASVMRAG